MAYLHMVQEAVLGNDSGMAAGSFPGTTVLQILKLKTLGSYFQQNIYINVLKNTFVMI